MEKLHESIVIEAPVARVWDVMLADSTFREWTAAFNPGSHYVGSWEQGSKILFLGPPEENGAAGMVSRIAQNRPHEYISIEHLGIVSNGVEDTTSPEATKWAPAYENYTFEAQGDRSTKLSIDMDVGAEHLQGFQRMWADALQRLKAIAEKDAASPGA